MSVRNIRDELRDNSTDYAGKTESEVADILNDLSVTSDVSYSVKGLTSKLGLEMGERLLASIEAASNSSLVVKHVLIALSAGGSVNVGDPVTQGMIDSFAANAELPLTVEDATVIKDLAKTRSWAQVNGCRKVKVGHIQEAKRLIIKEAEEAAAAEAKRLLEGGN